MDAGMDPVRLLEPKSLCMLKQTGNIGNQVATVIDRGKGISSNKIVSQGYVQTTVDVLLKVQTPPVQVHLLHHYALRFFSFPLQVVCS